MQLQEELSLQDGRSQQKIPPATPPQAESASARVVGPAPDSAEETEKRATPDCMPTPSDPAAIEIDSEPEKGRASQQRRSRREGNPKEVIADPLMEFDPWRRLKDKKEASAPTTEQR